MKLLRLLFFVLFLSCLTLIISAQSPNSFNYQAAIRGSEGYLLENQLISLRISILKNSSDGSVVYSETHSETTTKLGLVSIMIGKGNVVSGNMSNIPWDNDIYFIKTELDLAGGNDYKEISTAQLVSVPYALHAQTAGNVFSGDYNDLNNQPQIPDPVSGSEAAFDGWDKTASDDFSGNYDDLTNKPVFSVIPVGTILTFAGDDQNIPDGWLLCDGTALDPSEYPGLATVIKTYWGDGNNDTDPLTTFNLPDLRGVFLRGVDNEKGYDADRQIGSYQDDGFTSHNHSANAESTGTHEHNATLSSAGLHSHTATTANAGTHVHSATTSTAGNHSHYITEYNGSSDEDGDGTTSLMWDNENQFTKYLYTNSTGSHTHGVNINSNGNHAHAVNVNANGEHTHAVNVNSNGNHTHGISVGNTGISETRPKNMAVNYIIKY